MHPTPGEIERVVKYKEDADGVISYFHVQIGTLTRMTYGGWKHAHQEKERASYRNCHKSQL